MPVSRSQVPLEKIIEICERFYEQDGYVTWSEVGQAIGVSRQAIQLRLRAAIERGDIKEEQVERWQSMSSRAATTRERQAKALEIKRDRERRTLKILVTPENLAWLREESALRKVTSADIINGILTRERLRRLESEE